MKNNIDIRVFFKWGSMQYKVTVAGKEAHPSHTMAWSSQTSYWHCQRCRGAALAMQQLEGIRTAQQGIEGRRALGRIAKWLPPWRPKEGSNVQTLLQRNDRPVKTLVVF